MAFGEIYIKLIVTFPKDPKVRALARYGPDAGLARDLYVQMCLYCREMLSDGLVPADEIGLMVYPLDPEHGKQLAKQLASVGLIEEVSNLLSKEPSKSKQDPDFAYRVVAYLKRNGTREDAEKLSQVRAEAGRAGGYKSRKRPAHRTSKPNGKQTANQVGRQDAKQNISKTDSVSDSVESESRVIQTPSVSAGEPTPTQRSKRLTDAYAEAEPMCKWVAVNGVVLSAVKSGRFTDDEISAALLRMAADNRSVTIDSLRTELKGLPPQRGRASPNGRPSQPTVNPRDEWKVNRS